VLQGWGYGEENKPSAKPRLHSSTMTLDTRCKFKYRADFTRLSRSDQMDSVAGHRRMTPKSGCWNLGRE
jgi:alanine-alpha-ketoisovalerate/valine-pyruvate aminotransferase